MTSIKDFHGDLWHVNKKTHKAEIIFHLKLRQEYGYFSVKQSI